MTSPECPERSASEKAVHALRREQQSWGGESSMQWIKRAAFKENAVTTSILVLLCAGMFIFQQLWLFPGYAFIKFLFAVFFFVTCVSFAKYVFFNHRAVVPQLPATWLEREADRLIIAGAIIFVYAPLLTEGQYWYDDYWMYPGTHASDWITVGLSMLRPYHSLLQEMFWFVLPSSAYVIKWFSIVCLLAYSLTLHSWLLRKSGQRFLSLALALGLSLFSPLADHIGYSGTLAILPAMLAAGLSVIAFDNFFKKAQAKEWTAASPLAAASGLMLLFAFLLHQLAAPIVFLFLIICIYFDKEPFPSIRFSIFYVIFFGFCALVYLLSGKLLLAFYHQAFWQRTGYIGMHDIIPKAHFFFQTVMPAACDRLGVSLLGRLATSDKCYWRFVQYNSLWLRYAVLLAFIAGIIIVCFSYLFRRKKFVGFSMMLLSIPMSYFVFLILKEDGYLTYYAIPLLSVILFFFIIAIKEMISLFSDFKRTGALSARRDAVFAAPIVLLICVLAFQGNLYIRQYWVETSKEGYNYLKNTLSLQTVKKKKVHVFGVLIPGQRNVYSIFATKVALRELGYNPEHFSITTSDDEQKVSVIQGDALESIKKVITPEDLQFILSSYLHDAICNRYVCNSSPSARLKGILIKAGLLPDDYSRTAVVDLRWIKPTWIEYQTSKIKRSANKNEIDSYSKNVIGHLELIDYSQDKDLLNINGWAAIKHIDSKKSQASIILRSGDKSFQITGDMLESPDVAAYFKNDNYKKCRFNYVLSSVSEKMKPGIYEVWIYVENSSVKEKGSLQWVRPLEIKLPDN
jgi:hypothetical protein